MASITLKNISKRFGEVVIIPGLDLAIDDGDFVVFVGPSGCGKSTLLRLIAGLEEASGGALLIDGRNVTMTPPAKRELAMVFQSYALYPHMSVADNIGFPLKMAGLDKQAIDRKVNAAAATLNLTDYLRRKPKELSGGQRQRVAIGRAIVRAPKGFLFDEPLSNLDAALRVNMRLELCELHANLKTTMIYVTHDQVEAMTMASKIVVLNKGRIEQVGTPLDLYERPGNLFVAGFIGSPRMNFINGPIAAQYGCETLGIRPEHIMIARAGGAADPGAWRGTAGLCEHLGSDTFIHVRLEGGTSVTVRQQGHFGVVVGEPLLLTPMVQNIHRFGGDGKSLLVGEGSGQTASRKLTLK